MATLIFLATIITVFILCIKLIIRFIKKRNSITTFRTIGVIVLVYTLVWTFFYFISTDKAIPLGTDICFDDWCATVTKVERLQIIANEKPHGQFLILTLRMSNHARGIAQKPSEPRVHILDDQGYCYTFSKEGQQALESLTGKLTSIGAKLELHKSLETKLVFDIPQNANGLKALIEEGPFITKLLFHEDKKIFLL